MTRSRTHSLRLLGGIALALALVVPSGAALAQGGEGDPSVARPGGTLPGDPEIALVQVASGLVDPVNVADDGSGRLFVVERIGRIRIVDQDGTLLEDPFLDIRNVVKTDFLEQGLLGLAFPPDYDESGFFYVYYTDYSTNGAQRIVRYQVSGDENAADPDSARLILEIGPDPFVNHNGGNLVFGPDGYLYWSTGDGGRAGDPYELAQDVGSPYTQSVTGLFGIIGRIDVSRPDEESQRYAMRYAIPEDNPFAQSSQIQLAPADPAEYRPGARPEIWAYGLRNPWQFSFDNQSGDLYIADVGQNAWEEINFQSADAEGGRNYGWPYLEGSNCYPPADECPRSQVGVLPVAEYDHSQGDCSITGLGVHRGESSAALDGLYFSSDFCSGRIWGLDRVDGEWILQELLDTTLLVTGGGSSTFGDVYLTACSCAFGRDYDPFENPGGTVWRIVSADEVGEGQETAPLESDAEPAETAEPDATPEPDVTPEPEPEPDPEPTDEPGDDAEPTPDTDATPQPETPEATTAPDESPDQEGEGADEAAITLVARNNAFDTDTITVSAGAQVSLTIVNEDPLLHNFSLYRSEEALEPIFVGEPFSGPGTEMTYEFQAPEEPGEYYFRCDPHPVEMNGTFIVE